jgi:hypothetical protein
MFGEPTLPAVASLGLEPVDEIHHVVEPATDPERMQLLAMAMAMWVLPVPVPSTSTALRCWQKSPLARSRTSVSLMGVPSNFKSSKSLVERRVLMLLLASTLGGRVFYLDAPL